MTQNRHYCDPKVFLISIQELYEKTNFLEDIPYKLWADDVPDECSEYYKITKDKIIFIEYGYQSTNFGMDSKEKLERIQYALRDGVKEYKLFEENLEYKKNKIKKSKKNDNEILRVQKIYSWIINNFPAFEKPPTPKKFEFEDFLIKTGRNFDTSQYKNKYVVIDVETNGFRKLNDDLLSLSIYDPFSGVCYNRYFPLDLQPLVLTTFVHGITDENLERFTHWTQEEIEKIIDYFDLRNATILSYSGGKGTFDSDFIVNYCKRHQLSGFEKLNYENIKKHVPSAPFGSEGYLTKDNLCRIFDFEGISETHSSMNDCVLEWQLFDKVANGKYFFIQNHLYSYKPEYIIPVTYLNKYKELCTYADLKIKPLTGTAKKIFNLVFPETLIKKLKKFPTNITGITIEHGINYLLDAKKEDNSKFLLENRRHLDFVGSLLSRLIKIPVIAEDDGLINTASDVYIDLVEVVNNVTKVIIDAIAPVIDFIKNKIFKNGEIKSQELVISNDKKVLALCDLSNSESILEIKTNNILTDDKQYLKPNVTQQLYFQKNERNVFILSIDFITHRKPLGSEPIVDGIQINIYSVNIEEKEMPPIIYEWEYTVEEIQIFNIVKDSPRISRAELSKKTDLSLHIIEKTLSLFERNKVFEREGTKRKGFWKIQKDIKEGDKYIFSIRQY